MSGDDYDYSLMPPRRLCHVVLVEHIGRGGSHLTRGGPYLTLRLGGPTRYADNIAPGFAALADESRRDVFARSGVPASVLFGTAPAGLKEGGS